MIIRLTGGLGNQLFQWAYGRARAAEGLDIKYTLGEDMGASGYRLDRYPIDVPITTDEATQVGYWQSERYFEGVRNELRRDLARPRRLSYGAKATVNCIIEGGWPHSIAIHVRRCDSVNAPNHVDLSATDYYTRAMARMRELLMGGFEFFVLSDDPDWCYDHLDGGSSTVHIVGRHEPEEDLWIMSRCRHAIIANSTFSWWAAWLGPGTGGGTVIAPREWYKPEGDFKEDGIVPERWERL